jgi:hypothetical protein
MVKAFNISPHQSLKVCIQVNFQMANVFALGIGFDTRTRIFVRRNACNEDADTIASQQSRDETYSFNVNVSISPRESQATTQCLSHLVAINDLSKSITTRRQ